MDADSVEVVEESTESFDMDSAVDSIGSDLFRKTEESEEVEVDDEELAELSQEEAKEKEEKEETKEEVAKREPPQSWKKETHELWDSIPDAAKDYIERREEQMREGLEKDRTDANLGRTMRDIMTPHAALIKQQGIDEPTAVRYMLNAHYKLSSGTPEQRMAALKELSRSYGLEQNGESVSAIPPEVDQRLRAIESNLTASQQRTVNEMRAKIESTVDAFAKERPHFHDLQDDIAKFIKAGYELEDAYEKALWANPSTRQIEIDRVTKEKSEQVLAAKKEEAEKAKKAKSVNVKGRDTGRLPTAKLGTMEDTMRETLREIKNRN